MNNNRPDPEIPNISWYGAIGPGWVVIFCVMIATILILLDYLK